MEPILHIPHTEKKRVVILGGGFAGLKLARKLLGKHFQVVVIDRNNFHQFQPLFYQVATAGLEPSSISFPLRKIFQKHADIHFRMAEVVEILPADDVVITSIGVLSYDYLVIATGAVTNFFHMKDIQEHALQMKSVADAILIRNTILQNYENALNESDPASIAALMTVVIVGGGPTGVELAGAIAEMKRYILPKDYPELDFSLMKIFLFEGSSRLLGSMSVASGVTVRRYLENLGVEVRLSTLVKNYDGKEVILGDGSRWRSDTLIWAAGVSCQAIKGLDEQVFAAGGRIRTDPWNRVEGCGNIFAIGDIAYTPAPGYAEGHPQVAPVAIQQAGNLASNLVRLNKGMKMKAFRYIDKGTLATVGQNRAVAELPGIRMKGFPAWLLWIFVHLMSIVGVKNRFFIFVNWAWNYLTYDQSLRLLIRPARKKEDPFGERNVVD